MRVAPEGWPFIGVAWAIVAVLFWVGAWWAAIPMMLVAGWVAERSLIQS